MEAARVTAMVSTARCGAAVLMWSGIGWIGDSAIAPAPMAAIPEVR